MSLSLFLARCLFYFVLFCQCFSSCSHSSCSPNHNIIPCFSVALLLRFFRGKFFACSFSISVCLNLVLRLSVTFHNSSLFFAIQFISPFSIRSFLRSFLSLFPSSNRPLHICVTHPSPPPCPCPRTPMYVGVLAVSFDPSYSLRRCVLG